MDGDLMLFVDKDAVLEFCAIDAVTGEMQKERTTAGQMCTQRGVRYTPMTPAVKAIELYQRKGKEGSAQQVSVRMADLAPFVLARVLNGELVNSFGIHDIPKPVRLSRETVMQLSDIFGGQRQAAKV